MLISPTSDTIRNDDAGSGGFGALRGDRFHDGIDWLCLPRQGVVAPCDCRVQRIIYPYGDDLSYRGVVLEGKDTGDKIFIILFYVDAPDGHVGKIFRQGEILGTAQDISVRYPNRNMKPHVHMSVFKPYNYRENIKQLDGGG